MAANVSYCEKLVRDEDRDRFLATLFAAARFRPALFALYAFDLEIAHVAARISEPAAGEVRLHWWHDVVTGAGREQAAGSPVAAALLETIARYQLRERPLVDLIEAQRDALYRRPAETIGEFEEWAGKAHGATFALAAQILSDGRDPGLDDLSRHSGIAFACVGAALEGNVQEYADLAERHLEQVRAGFPFPSETNAAFLPLALVRPMLRRLTTSAVPLPPWRRQWILWRASRNLAKHL